MESEMEVERALASLLSSLQPSLPSAGPAHPSLPHLSGWLLPAWPLLSHSSLAPLTLLFTPWRLLF